MTFPEDDAFDPASIPDILPVLPLKDVVVFPYIIVPLSIGRESSVQAVDRALGEGRVILLAPQKDPELEEPGKAEDFHEIGTAALIMRMLKLPDGRIRILVQGLCRARLEHLGQSEPYPLAKITVLDESDDTTGIETEALVRSVKDDLENAVNQGKSLSSEVMVIAANLEDPGRLADLVASNLELTLEQAEGVLAELEPLARIRRVHAMLARELELLGLKHEIASQARGEIDRGQREYFLRHQLRAIQEELGEADEVGEEVGRYRATAEKKGLSEEAEVELERQLRRLERSQPDSAEGSVIRSYLDWLTGLPWTTRSDDNLDLANAREVLDEDHFGLERVKERIIEYLAVRKLNPSVKGPILCFVGPPGVGKTSLGRSVARALGRKFVRLSLGGVRDEAEIRGHRRTYVGALPGRILQGIHQAETSNPVFMLDEIDKLGSDYRGDPSAALLEVLDPEQNGSFRDHFLGLEYDLSGVMFITTANQLEPVLPAFLDRMEIIRIPGYSRDEKLAIARRHLIPKQIAENGLEDPQIRFTGAALDKILEDYAKEAGLRNLEREIASICRKVAVQIVGGRDRPTRVDARKVETWLGPPRHFNEELLDQDRIGVATGLAWTSAGGDILLIEVAALPGEGKLVLTGRLGDVMRESAQTALSFVRSWAAKSVDKKYFRSHDFHVHVPAGSVPKDGPSAGIAIATAFASLASSRPVDHRLAMTGELTLRGEILPIGGLREKVLAAALSGVQTVLLPATNRRDLEEVPKPLRKQVDLRLVSEMSEVLELALVS